MGNSGSFSNKDFHAHSLIMDKRKYDKYTKYTFLYDTYSPACARSLRILKHGVTRIYLVESLADVLLGS